MRALTAGMIVALAQEVTTLVHCWSVTRTDFNTFFFTDHVEDLKIDGNVYKAATGMTASAIAGAGDLSVGNLEVIGMLTSTVITDGDLLNGLWDYAAVQIFQVDYTNLANGKIILRTGTLGQVSSGRNTFKVELRGLAEPLQQMFGRTVSPACDTDLGSSACTVNMAGNTVGGRAITRNTTVGSTPGDQVTIIQAALIGIPPETTTNTAFFVGGTIKFTSGQNTGAVREIKSFDSTTGKLIVFEPFVNTISNGDAFTLVAGCDKNIITCKSKFNNVINFQGFPQLPGRDALAKGPT